MITKKTLMPQLAILSEKYTEINDLRDLPDEESEKRRNSCVELLEQMEKLIEEYLAIYPNDSDMWVRLALTVDQLPLADTIKAISCLKKAIECNPQNAYALLVLAYKEDRFYGTQPDTIEKLYAFKTDDKELMSLIEYAKTYDDKRDPETKLKNIKAIVNSVLLWPYHVKNMYALSGYLASIGEEKLSQACAQIGLSNIKYVLDENESPYEKGEAYFDPMNYITEYIAGTQLSWVNRDFYKTMAFKGEKSTVINDVIAELQLHFKSVT